jgi:hypothetical protein
VTPRRPLLLLLVVLALALPGPAGAAIVVQKGIAGVRLGMSRAAVRAVLGTPLRVTHGANEFGAYTEYRYPRLLRVTFQGDLTVTAVSTAGRAERTAAGVGVGSPEADVRSSLPRARCETAGAFRHCYVGAFRPGARVTDFVLRRGLVARVTVGFVID